MPPKRTLRTYAAAFTRSDLDGLVGLYAEQTDYRQPFLPDALRTPDAIRAFEGAMFSGFSGTTCEIEWLVAGGNEGAAGVVIRSTHTAAMPLPDGSVLPATNRTIELHSSEHMRVDDEGKIVEHRRYVDTASMMAQLGVLPG